MKVAVLLSFHEQAALRLLNWLATENAIILRRYPYLPGLYDSGVRYTRERDEIWCDYLSMLTLGMEDCDGLSAARAGELLARGWRALLPTDGGYAEAKRLKPARIQAEVFLRTGSTPDNPGLYHCLVRYWVNGREYRDDPSARLGMHGGVIAPEVLEQWARRKQQVPGSKA